MPALVLAPRVDRWWNKPMRGVGAGVLAISLSACSDNGVLSPRGPIAAANKAIMLNSLAIMLAIVIPTLVAVFGFAWWFRAGNRRAHYDPGFVFSGRIEAVVWGIPFLTIVFISGLIWIGSHHIDPYKPIASNEPALEVQVVSLDWKWLFIYPAENIASVNKLVLPIGRSVHFNLTSSSVMNSFFVPQLGSQIYTMNGMTTQLHLLADRVGVYRGQSSHFSGDGFADMNFPVHAVTTDDFGQWVDTARGSGKLLDAAAYAKLAEQSAGHPATTFSAVQPDLFDAIVQQRIAPARGPQQHSDAEAPVSPKGKQ